MWFKINGEQVTFNILAKPNAKKTALVKVTDTQLNIAIHAKPQDGAANTELIAYLARLLRVPKSQVILQRGFSGRHKHISVPLTELVKQFLLDPNKPL